MMKKKFFAVALAAVMTVGSAFSALAAENVEGIGWWDAANGKSSAVELADGQTVTFKIDVAATEEEDKYAAFCVEVTDGTNYFTTTSAGDCWGAGAFVNDLDKANAAKGGSYTVSMTRTGNDFAAKYVDNATGEAMFNDLTLTGNAEFGATTVYVMGQVGTLTVEQIVDTEDENVTETVEGNGWWDASNGKSSAVELADGQTVTFKIDVAATEEEDKYAAFCVEVTDGTNYFTTTSAGDCWGAGAFVNDLDKANAAKGGSYTVSVTRTGNDFVVKYVDNATGQAMFNDLTLTGNVEFGATTVYVMGQVGTLAVGQVKDTNNQTPPEPTTLPASEPTSEPATEPDTLKNTPADQTTAAADKTTTAATNSPKTGDAAPIAVLMVVALGACGAVVASKRREAK